MDQSDLDRILAQLDDKSSWLHLGALAGQSQLLRQFTERVQELGSVHESRTQSSAIILTRTGRSEQVDNALVSALGFSDTLRINLHSGSNVYNHCELFGMGLRPGIFEAPDSAIVIRGVECLNTEAVDRLYQQAQIWLAQRLKHLLLIGEPTETTEQVTTAFTDAAQTVSLELPDLAKRTEDLPFVFHFAAALNHGGLDQFSVEAVRELMRHPWTGGLAQVENMIRGMYVKVRKFDADSRFTDEDVRIRIADAAPRQARHTEQGQLHDSIALWREVQDTCDDVDRLTTSLASFPFFAAGAAATTQSPLGMHWPELDFLRLVSWAYATFIEKAEPNLRCVQKLFGGQQMSPDKVLAIRDSIVRLRTFLQHSLQYSSDHDQETIQYASQWFQNAVGRSRPDLEDYEDCIRALLLQIHELLNDLLKFLRRVNEDEFQEMTLVQWKRRRETSWPRCQYEAIVGTAIKHLGRSDLKTSVVCDSMLSEMRERLKATTEDDDRERILLSLTEERITDRYPKQLPVTGTDLLELGVHKGPEVGEMLSKLRECHKQNAAIGRDELLSRARQMLAVQSTAVQ